jgi:hypothetical protein
MANPVSAPLGAAAIARPGATAAAGAVAAAAGAAGGSSRFNFTVGRGISGTAGLAAVTWTREVSFLGLGVVTGMPITAVSFLASSSGTAGATGLGLAGAAAGAGELVRPVKPGGKLMRTVSFLDSSSGMLCCGFSSAMNSTLRNDALG